MQSSESEMLLHSTGSLNEETKENFKCLELYNINYTFAVIIKVLLISLCYYVIMVIHMY